MKKVFLLCIILLFLHTKSFCQYIYIDSLKQKFASEKEDTAKVNTLFNLALTYVFTYADSGITYATQGLQLAQKTNYTSGEAHCMGTLCLGLTFLGNFSGALNFGFKALDIYKNQKDTSQLIWTNLQIMNCYYSQEDYEQALVNGYEAKKLFGWSHSDSVQESIVLGVLGSVYGKLNHFDSALYYALKADAMDDGTGAASNVAQKKQGLGEIYAKMGHADIALNYYRQALPSAVKHINFVALVGIYNDMSKVFQSIGNTDSAIYYANKSIMQSGVYTNLEGLLTASTQLAGLYEARKMPDSTIKYLKLATVLKDSLFNRKKTREAQNFAFNEKMHQQELIAQEQQNANATRSYALLAVIIIFLLIAFFLWRNNKQKQKANILLQHQKQKVESTLTELKSTQAQLIQSEKMASLGELTAGIAHEIQNPLNFVNNFSEVSNELLDEMKIEFRNGNGFDAFGIADEIKENLEKILHHGKRADAIVKAMLQHSRTSTGTKEPTDINTLCDEYLRLAYHGLRAKEKDFNPELKTLFDNSIGKINIVPQDIGRLLLNLINNAFYAVSEKQKTESSKQNAESKIYEPTVSLSTKKINSKMEIIVSDNGNGIPQKIVDKIFQPFFTTKPTGQGIGLGLSLSYDIVKAHSGEIKVETKETEGTKFIIQLPLNNF